MSCVMKCLLLLALLGIPMASTVKTYDGYKVYKVLTKSTEEATQLDQIIADLEHPDIWHRDQSNVDIMIAPDEQNQFISSLKAHNLEYKVNIENVGRNKPGRRKMPATTKTCVNKRSCSLDVDFDRYLTYNEIQSYQSFLAKKYPDLVTLITIGESSEGRQMTILKISDKNVTKIRPAILIDGAIHAREWIAPAQVLYIINQLTENLATNWDIIQDIDWYFLPVINPDGYEYSFENDRFWRKSRSNPNNQTGFCIGTDLNRNWDFHFQEEKHTKNPCSETYSGPTPFSEIEILNLRNFAANLTNLKLYISFHNYGNAILYPWGVNEVGNTLLNKNELHDLGVGVSQALTKKYKVGSTFNLMYTTPGQSMDWLKSELGIPLVYTIELPGGGDGGFDLEEEEILPVVTDMFKGVRVFGQYLLNNYRG